LIEHALARASPVIETISRKEGTKKIQESEYFWLCNGTHQTLYTCVLTVYTIALYRIACIKMFGRTLLWSIEFLHFKLDEANLNEFDGQKVRTLLLKSLLFGSLKVIKITIFF
jgi:hypothetical protein